jgi:uncharacterized protein YqgV (UPF0045/DUF77 family)
MIPRMIRAEFTVYPFIEGEGLPRHVEVAIHAIRGAGLEVEVGALSNSVSGPAPDVLAALRDGLVRSVEEGATRIVINIESEP